MFVYSTRLASSSNMTRASAGVDADFAEKRAKGSGHTGRPSFMGKLFDAAEICCEMTNVASNGGDMTCTRHARHAASGQKRPGSSRHPLRTSVKERYIPSPALNTENSLDDAVINQDCKLPAEIQKTIDTTKEYPLSSTSVISLEKDLERLVIDRECIMEEIKKSLGPSANFNRPAWAEDEFLQSSCISSSCFRHCVICDVCLSGQKPMKDHQQSGKHQKRLKLRKDNGALAERTQPECRNTTVIPSSGKQELQPCGIHGCTHHCVCCDKCMTGAKPAQQHLESEKHKKKETDATRFGGVGRMDATLGISVMDEGKFGINLKDDATGNLDGDFDDISPIKKDFCGHLGCVYHCICCDRHLYGLEPMKQHVAASSHISMSRRCGQTSGPKIPSALTSSSSMASDIGFKSETSYMGNPVENIESYLEKLQLSPSQQIVSPVQPKVRHNVNVTPTESCKKVGCFFHCSICDVCLSGEPPKQQHLASRKHQQVAERVRKLQSGGDTMSSLQEKNYPKFDAQKTRGQFQYENSNEMNETLSCSQVGCQCHCNICDVHLSGDEPMQQHLVSQQHEKKKATALRLGQQLHGGTSEIKTSPLEPGFDITRDQCAYNGCAYHCAICNVHLSGRGPLLQHIESQQHTKGKEIFQGINYRQQQDTATSDFRNDKIEPFGRTRTGDASTLWEFPSPQSKIVPFEEPSEGALGRSDGFSSTRSAVGSSTFHSEYKESKTNMTKATGFGACPNNVPICQSSDRMRLASLDIGQDMTDGLPSLGLLGSQDIGGNVVKKHAQKLTTTKCTSNAAPPGLDVFAPCPQNYSGCSFHCLACDKHFNDQLPKGQHELSSKHIKAARRYLSGLIFQPSGQIDPYITKSATSSEFALKRQLKTSKPSAIMIDPPESHAESRCLQPVNKLTRDREDYIPQTKTPPRDYQKELYQKAMFCDSICFLPTGAGKTLVAALVIDHMLELNPGRQVLFLVEKMLLVFQQTKYLRSELGDKSYRRISSKTKKEERRKLRVAGMCRDHVDAEDGTDLAELDIIVSTAGFFENVLTKKMITWDDFCLVVLDEAHHTCKKHVFNLLMTNHHNQLDPELRPKLLGLTASPAGEKSVTTTMEKLKELLQNVGDAKLCMVEEHAGQLKHFKSRTEIEVHVAEMNDCEVEVKKHLQQYLLHIFNFLLKTTNLGCIAEDIGLDTDTDSPWSFLLMQFENENLITLKKSITKGLVMVDEKLGHHMKDVVKKILDHSLVIIAALQGLYLLGEAAVMQVLQPLTDKENDCGFLVMKSIGFESSHLTKNIMGGNYEIEERLSSMAKEGRMPAFAQLVEEILSTADQAISGMGRKPIIMVIVRERVAAKLLANLLEALPSLRQRDLKVQYIVGHGDGEVGMTVKQQRRCLADIWDYKCQVLVATSVAEEGIDLPECELVIEMSPPSSVTSLVQIRGRARKQQSRLVAICRTEFQKCTIQDLLDRESCMMEAAEAMNSSCPPVNYGSL